MTHSRKQATVFWLSPLPHPLGSSAGKFPSQPRQPKLMSSPPLAGASRRATLSAGTGRRESKAKIASVRSCPTWPRYFANPPPARW
ncbi:MAG: hypothetical protein ACOX5N_06575 [Bacilli bacterium]